MATKEGSVSPSTRRYNPEKKAQAVRLVRQLRAELGTEHGTIGRVARQLGHGEESVRNWVRQADIDDGVKPGTTTTDAERLKALEQENRELKRANAILRSASAFFALCQPEKALAGWLVSSLPSDAVASRRCAARESAQNRPQATVLHAPVEQPGSGVRELARRTHSDPMNAKRRADRLEACGLVISRTDREHRQLRVLATERSATLARELAGRAASWGHRRRREPERCVKSDRPRRAEQSRAEQRGMR